jgi:hypothetical protein
MTKETATTFMRWVIVLSLFGAVIYQSNRIEALQHQLVVQDRFIIELQVRLVEAEQQYSTLMKSCLK